MNSTHAVFDALTGEVVKEFPDISTAFRYNAEVGGPMRGYVVAPINRPPVARHAPASRPEPEYVPEAADEDGPGLFD